MRTSYLILLSGVMGSLMAADTIEQEPRVIPLTMERFLSSVAETNYGLAARRLDVEISRIQAQGERGVLEPSLVGTAGIRKTERQNTIEESISQNASQFIEDADNFSGGVEGTLPWGTQYWVGTSLDKRRNNLTTAAIPTPFTAEYITFSGVRIIQPLLKGAGMRSVMARARVANIEVRIKHEELRKQTMELVSQAELAYWNLTLFQHLRDLREDSVRIAEKVLEDNRERVKAGKMAETEILEAEVGLALRQSQLAEARQSVVAAGNLVRAFMSEAPDWEDTVHMEATDFPQIRVLEVDFASSMAEAVRLHPDYVAWNQIIDQEDVRVAYMESQRWPQVDLVASYGLNGLGDSMSSSYSMIGRTQYEAWAVGIEVRIPLGGGIRERADLMTAKKRKLQALLELKTAQVDIGNALSTALNRVKSTQEQARYYQRMVGFNERLLESEINMLDAGKSDSRRVLQVEQELVDAKISYHQSLVAHNWAWLDWEVAEGSLLVRRDIEPTYAK